MKIIVPKSVHLLTTDHSVHYFLDNNKASPFLAHVM